MPITHDRRVKDSRIGCERIDRWINTLFRNRTFKVNECVKLSERCCGCRVRRIVRRHVNRLNGSDSTALCRCDSLLQCTHLCRQRWLVTHRRWHTPEQRRYFGTRLGKSEDVVHEQQRVLAGRISEVLGHGQRGQSDSKTSSWRLVHLTEHHARLFNHLASRLADFGFLHFQPQVGPFASALSHTSKNRIAAVSASNSSDQLLQNNRLAQTCTAEQTGLTTSNERGEQVDNFDTGLENFRVGRQLGYLWSLAMDRPIIIRLNRTTLIDRLTQNVEDASQCSDANWDRHRLAQVDAIQATHESVRTTECNASNTTATEVLLHFGCQVDLNALLFAFNFDCVVNRGQIAFRKLCVKRRANNLTNSSYVFCSTNAHCDCSLLIV